MRFNKNGNSDLLQVALAAILLAFVGVMSLYLANLPPPTPAEQAAINKERTERLIEVVKKLKPSQIVEYDNNYFVVLRSTLHGVLIDHLDGLKEELLFDGSNLLGRLDERIIRPNDQSYGSIATTLLINMAKPSQKFVDPRG